MHTLFNLIFSVVTIPSLNLAIRTSVNRITSPNESRWSSRKYLRPEVVLLVLIITRAECNSRRALDIGLNKAVGDESSLGCLCRQHERL